MRRPYSGALAAVFLGVVLGLGVGCEPIDPGKEIPPGVSDTICYQNSDCAPNGCCGEATHPTHVSEAPDCSSVRCTGTCEPHTIDCGRCIAACRDSRCESACQ
jgi:hypothetical protein